MHQSSRRRSGLGPSAATIHPRKTCTATSTVTSTATSVLEAPIVSTSRQKQKPSPNMTRRTTTQSSHHKSSRTREREWDREQEGWYEEERESFPQYCMSCEKQFVPKDDRFLYCSEACRVHDQNHSSNPSKSSSAQARSYASPTAYSSANYPYYSAEYAESRDIIPRASPSRPGSMHYSPPASSTLVYHGSATRSMSMQDGAAGSYSSRHCGTKKGYSSTYDHSTYHPGYSDVSTLDRPLPRRATTYSRPKSIELVTPMIGR